jgi:hypothetical protein
MGQRRRAFATQGRAPVVVSTARKVGFRDPQHCEAAPGGRRVGDHQAAGNMWRMPGEPGADPWIEAHDAHWTRMTRYIAGDGTAEEADRRRRITGAGLQIEKQRRHLTRQIE